jgi:hypothetical protein
LLASQVLLKESKAMEITGSHEANQTYGWLRSHVQEVKEHLPYCPNLMPSDFQLFGPLNKHLAGEGFATDVVVKKAVTWQQTLDIDFFCAVMWGLWGRN